MSADEEAVERFRRAIAERTGTPEHYLAADADSPSSAEILLALPAERVRQRFALPAYQQELYDRLMRVTVLGNGEVEFILRGPVRVVKMRRH